MIENRLRVLLAERKMNMRQLAELTGVQYTTIRRFAGDEITSIHKKTLEKVCAALGVQPGDIFVYRPQDR
jgi:putative transcriptional regulator